MVDLWLNDDESILSNNFVSHPTFERDQLLTDTTSNALNPISNLVMSWDTLGNKVEPYDVLSVFKVLKPKFEGKYDTVEKEIMSLRHSYDWAITMVVCEYDAKIFEAALLLTVLVNLLDEETMKQQTLIEDWSILNVFGYTMTELLDMIGEKLAPKLMDRLKVTLKGYFKLQSRVQKHSVEGQFNLFVNLKGSYDRYLRFRNLDGFFEGTLLPLFAVMNNDGSKLSVGVCNDTIEACILLHDTNNIIRHFLEKDIANSHRYTNKDVETSILMAFARARDLYKSVRNSDIDLTVKLVCCTYIMSFHSHANFTERYGCGIAFAKAHYLAMAHIKQLPEQHMVIVKDRIEFDKIHNMYKKLQTNMDTLKAKVNRKKFWPKFKLFKINTGNDRLKLSQKGTTISSLDFNNTRTEP